MDIRNKMKIFFPDIKKGIERFPVTILFGIMSFICAVIGNEITYKGAEYMVIAKISILWAKLFAVGIPLSATVELIREKYFSDKKKQIFRLVSFAITMAFLFGFKIWMDNAQGDSTINIVSMGVIFYASFLLFPIIDRKNDKEKYLQTVVGNQLLTIAFAIVLYLGIAIILTAIDLLMIGINRELYIYTLYFSALIFGVIFFVSKLKGIDESLEDYEIPKMAQILYSYIIIPLIMIYTLVLYLYSAKILILLKMPKGMVSNLVLWYMVFSIFVIIMVTPLTEENRIAEKFKKFFPIISLPLICMAIFSISERIFQYGVTEKRYIIVALSIWLLLNMIIYIIRPDVRKVLISLIIIMFITVFSPWNMTKVSLASQTKRLIKLLTDNGLMKDGKLSKNDNVSGKAKKEIISLINYFYYDDIGNKKIRIDGKEYASATDFMKEIGANSDWNNYNSYSTIEITKKNILTEVKGYDYFISLSEYTSYEHEKIISGGEIDIQILKNGEMVITDNKKNEKLATIPIKSELNKIIASLKNEIKDDNNIYKIEVPSEKLTFTGENEKIKYKVEFSSITLSNKDIITSYYINMSFSEK